MLVIQLCPIICDPMDYKPIRLLCPWNSPGKNTPDPGIELFHWQADSFLSEPPVSNHFILFMFLCNRNTGRRLLSSSNLGSFMLSELDISGHCGVLKASWASNMVYSRGRQLMLAVGWKLEHLHMISSVFSLDEEGFLTQWLISFKANVLSGENQVKVAQHFLTQPQK